MPKKSCGATIELEDGAVLTCDMPFGHAGPLHGDDGHQWGDPDLPAPA